MAFVVPRPSDRWEIRESRMTPKGPRSRTLATFRELTDEVLERARSKAESPFDDDTIRKAALRAGAPLAEPRADRLARELLGELGRGRRPATQLGRLLAAALDEGVSPQAQTAQSIARWANAGPGERGRALNDLLLLADALPTRRRERELRFPKISTSE